METISRNRDTSFWSIDNTDICSIFYIKINITVHRIDDTKASLVFEQ